MNLIVRTAAFAIYVFCSLSGAAADTSETQPNINVAVVEMLIVCDQNLLSQFGNNWRKMNEFWFTQIWEANARFKSLVKAKMEVRVVDVILLKDESILSKHNLTATVINFSKWLYKNMNISKRFDMAILAIGDKTNFRTGTWSDSGRMCQIDHEFKMHSSVAMIKFHREFKDFSSVFAQSIAELINTPPNEKAPNSCGQSALNLLSGVPPTKGRFFYSECADDAIFRQLQAETTECLFDHDKSTDHLANYSYAVPSSLRDQCELIARNSRIFNYEPIIGNENNRCVKTECYIYVFSFGVSSFGTTPMGVVFPLENTPCGANSNCFRGVCLEKGYQIQNLKSGNCLRSDDWFVSDDHAALTFCKNVATPLETLRIEKGSQGKRLLTVYSKPHSTETLNKCLVVNKTNLVVHFQKCENSSEEYWKLFGAGSNKKAFLLFHPLTKRCFYINDKNELAASQSCNSLDSRYLWHLYGDKLSSNAIKDFIDDGNKRKKQKSCSWFWEIFG